MTGVNGFKPDEDLITDKSLISVDCVTEVRDRGDERLGFRPTTEAGFRVFAKVLRPEIVIEESVLQMLQ